MRASNATIVGGEGHVYYEFWTTTPIVGCKRNTRIGKGWFANDEEAEAYARVTFPNSYAAGIEARCFDGSTD